MAELRWYVGAESLKFGVRFCCCLEGFVVKFGKTWAFGLAALSLSACEPFEGMEGAPNSMLLANVPESVLEVAAPNQNLKAIRINPVDGCYEYQHNGPVETTFLPLRTAKGQPICTRAPE